jgi:hypothetical protein
MTEEYIKIVGGGGGLKDLRRKGVYDVKRGRGKDLKRKG